MDKHSKARSPVSSRIPSSIVSSEFPSYVSFCVRLSCLFTSRPGIHVTESHPSFDFPSSLVLVKLLDSIEKGSRTNQCPMHLLQDILSQLKPCPFSGPELSPRNKYQQMLSRWVSMPPGRLRVPPWNSVKRYETAPIKQYGLAAKVLRARVNSQCFCFVREARILFTSLNFSHAL